MIVTFLRSSSIGTLSMCEMQYFFEYVLGRKNKTNRKAVMGTVMHRVLQVLGDKKIAMSKGQNLVVNDDIPNLTFEQCDNIDYITNLCFKYYKEHEYPDLEHKDKLLIIAWVYKALAYKNGMLDPRNQEVHATELFFDIEIKKPWAKYKYNVAGEEFSGYLGIKGTVDLIIKEDDNYFQVLDYKSGRRLNWATGKEKTQADLEKDPQLLLYYYALKTLYPDQSFYVSIYYVNDGGLFDIVFTDDDFEKAEKMIRQRFEYIRSVEMPKQISRDQSHWKCQKLCGFSILEKDGKTACQCMRENIEYYGMDETVRLYGDMEKINSYGAGGGRLDKGSE